MRIDGKVCRLGVTMRRAQDPITGEVRDALARDWGRFLQAAVPEIAWCPLPNVGQRIVDLALAWSLDAICFTGGEDVGADAERDATEHALVDHCVARHLPMLGICRGAQLLWTRFGGGLVRIDGHVGERHDVQLLDDPAGVGGRHVVNSYHTLALDGAAPAGGLTPLAHAADGSIEAVRGNAPPMLGLMWHPEREADPAPLDVQLLRWLFGRGAPV